MGVRIILGNSKPRFEHIDRNICVLEDPRRTARVAHLDQHLRDETSIDWINIHFELGVEIHLLRGLPLRIIYGLEAPLVLYVDENGDPWFFDHDYQARDMMLSALVRPTRIQTWATHYTKVMWARGPEKVASQPAKAAPVKTRFDRILEDDDPASRMATAVKKLKADLADIDGILEREFSQK